MKNSAKAFMPLLCLVLCFNLFACGKGAENQKPTLVRFYMEAPPAVTEYALGERADLTGIILKAEWSDGLKARVSLSDCAVSPSAPLTAADEFITVTYKELSVFVPITVITEGVKSISVSTGNMTLKGSLNSKMDLSGITVTAHYVNGKSRAIKAYTLKDGENEIKDPAAAIFGVKGIHVITAEYLGKTAAFEVEIFNGFIIEAENIILPQYVTDADVNFVERVRDSADGIFDKKQNPSEPASGGAYMGSIFKGAVMRFHFYLDSARAVNVKLRAASGYMTKSGTSGSWIPAEMGEMRFNEIFDVKYGAKEEIGALSPLKVADDVVLKGGVSDNPAGDSLLWVNWVDVDFGRLELEAGANVIEMEVVSEYVNCLGLGCACNIDRLEIAFDD